jgi:sulfite reductase (NADPH) flavoprotein alpha-component
VTEVKEMVIPVLPESAPFTPSQRAWLNGFFAGVLSLDGTSSSNPNAASIAQFPATANGQAAVAEPEEEFPWHDATLPIEERLQLAEGKPLKRVLMAAMAQLDCGSCGYICQTYAEAIASGEEKSLTKCVPGGKETAKRLKEIMAEAPA